MRWEIVAAPATAAQSPIWDTLATPVIAALASIIGAVFTYWAVRRKNSGDIDTSDATALWREATLLRTELRDRIYILETEVERLRVENASLGLRVKELEWARR